MKLRQSARVSKGKALASVRASVIAFNGLDDDGRVTEVLLRMQHGFEMLMKAALNKRGVTFMVGSVICNAANRESHRSYF